MAFCGEVGNWNWLEKSGGAPLNLLSSGEIVPCFGFLTFMLPFNLLN